MVNIEVRVSVHQESETRCWMLALHNVFVILDRGCKTRIDFL